jgi:hypothetical protein
MSCPTSAQVSGRKTLVLVHGFYHGGWCWRGVADLLEVRGHKFYAHRLPATATARIFSVSTSGLDTQIADIANLVIWEDLNDVCLLRIRLAAVPRRARFASVQSSGSTRSNRSTDRKVSSTFRSSRSDNRAASTGSRWEDEQVHAIAVADLVRLAGRFCVSDVRILQRHDGISTSYGMTVQGRCTVTDTVKFSDFKGPSTITSER